MGDVKAQMAIASAWAGWAPRPSIRCSPSMRRLARSVLPGLPALCVGKVKAPEVVKAGPLALEAARSADLELPRHCHSRYRQVSRNRSRRAACRADLRVGFLEVLQTNLSDYSPGVRAKAVRSLGKLAKHGHLTAHGHGSWPPGCGASWARMRISSGIELTWCGKRRRRRWGIPAEVLKCMAGRFDYYTPEKENPSKKEEIHARTRFSVHDAAIASAVW